jgi:hypothetical protein
MEETKQSKFTGTYSQFMRDHQLPKGSKADITSHTKLCDRSSGIFGASYRINDDELQTFFELYHHWVFVSGADEYLVERQCITNRKMVIDLDFRFSYDVTTRQYTHTMIDDFIYVIRDELKDLFVFQPNDSFTVYIMEKPEVNIDKTKQIIKDGIHLIFDVAVPYHIQMHIRKNVIERMATNTVFDIPVTNDWHGIYDDKLSMGTNGLTMLGSKKPHHTAYELTAYVVSKFQNDGSWDTQKMKKDKNTHTVSLNKLIASSQRTLVHEFAPSNNPAWTPNTTTKPTTTKSTTLPSLPPFRHTPFCEANGTGELDLFNETIEKYVTGEGFSNQMGTGYHREWIRLGGLLKSACSDSIAFDFWQRATNLNGSQKQTNECSGQWASVKQLNTPSHAMKLIEDIVKKNKIALYHTSKMTMVEDNKSLQDMQQQIDIETQNLQTKQVEDAIKFEQEKLALTTQLTTLEENITKHEEKIIELETQTQLTKEEQKLQIQIEKQKKKEMKEEKKRKNDELKMKSLLKRQEQQEQKTKLAELKDQQVKFNKASNIFVNDDKEAVDIIYEQIKDRFVYSNGSMFFKNEQHKWVHNKEDINDYLKNHIFNQKIYLTNKDYDLVPYCGKMNHTRNIQDGLITKLKINKKDDTFYAKFHMSTKNKLCFKDGVLDFKKRSFVAWEDLTEEVYTTVIIDRCYAEHFNNIDRASIDKVMDIFRKMFGADTEKVLQFYARAISGNFEDKNFMSFSGNRNCGKGLLFDLFKFAFCDYICGFDLENLMVGRESKKSSDNAKENAWLSCFEFARCAIAQETDDNVNGNIHGSKKLSNKKLKSIMSGGDEIYVRGMYENQRTITIDTTLSFFGNNELSISGDDSDQHHLKLSGITQFITQEKYDEYLAKYGADYVKPYGIRDENLKNEVKTNQSLINAMVHLLFINWRNIPITISSSGDDDDDRILTVREAIFTHYEITGNPKNKVSKDQLFDKLGMDKKKILAELKELGCVGSKDCKMSVECGDKKQKQVQAFQCIKLKTIEPEPNTTE